MNKLLDKPFRAFTLYAMLILLCSIPVYYIVVNNIWMDELDEHNTIVKEQIVHRLAETPPETEQLDGLLKLWNILQPGVTLTPATFSPGGDSLYTVTRKNNYHKDETDRFRGLLTPVRIRDQAYVLRIETNVEEADETIVAIGLVTIFFFVVLVAGFIILNKRIARNVWQPFYETLTRLRSFDLLSEVPVIFEKSSVAEFDELHTVLQRLIENNIAVFRQQKAFIENASHELQTPLALLKSRVDILLQDKHVTEKQLEMLNGLQVQLARVSRVNKNLLLLARIENNQFTEVEELNVHSVLQETLVLFADYIGDRRIVVNSPVSPFMISSNKFLLETLISNLLTNAIKHSAVKSELVIELQRNVLSFYNTGTSALDQEKLFKRYSIVSAETTSSGLGLAIVKEIARYNEWRVDYSFQHGSHCFSVHFD